jgi:hypothetical protein
MGLIRKLIAGKLVAKAVQKLNQKAAATTVASRPYAGRYIPATAGTMPAARTGIADKALAFYERNPKLVAGAATILMAAVAAGLSKGRRLR